MKPLLLPLSQDFSLAEKIAAKHAYDIGDITVRRFPDGETYVRIHTPVAGRQVVIVATLDRPDDKLLSIIFLAKTAKELGAKGVFILAPYLAYLRQDRLFHEGEGLSSLYFAQILSGFFNGLITVDPHLHRYHSLKEIYPIPTVTLHATQEICSWIKQNITQPLLIGPDSESAQWVTEAANNINCPYIILEKNRRGDRDVEISVPELSQWKGNTPVLIDDIISTARTMCETLTQLKTLGLKSAACVGVHAVFAQGAYESLTNAGVKIVATCNTIPHPTNCIDLSDLMASGLESLLNSANAEAP